MKQHLTYFFALIDKKLSATLVTMAVLLLTACQPIQQNALSKSNPIADSSVNSSVDPIIDQTTQPENHRIFPQSQRWKTAQGLTVTLIENSSIPMVDIQLTFAAGSARDASKAGLASMTNAGLLWGSNAISEERINLHMDELGAQISVTSARDMAKLSLRCLSDQTLDHCQQLLLDILTIPQFPQVQFDRFKQNRQVVLKRNQQIPSAVGNLTFWQALFEDHPYGSPQLGTVESIEAIQPADLQQFFHQFYTAQNGHLVFVGDIKQQRAQELASTISRLLPQNNNLSDIPEAPTNRPTHINTPMASQQSHLFIGQRGLNRDHPDYVAFYLGNMVMGGGALTSVLGNEIREKRGWAYSIWSANRPMLASSVFMVNMQTQSSNADQAIDLLTDILSQSTNFLTDERIERSRQFLLGNLPLQLDSNSEILNYYSTISFYKLPENYLNQFYDRLIQTTADQVREAWRKQIQVDQWVIVNVGGSTNATTDKTR